MTQDNLPPRAPLPSAKSTDSYWHKEPSEILRGHRTTKTLPRDADIVIVGSGIAGAFAAWQMLMEGKGNGEKGGIGGNGERFEGNVVMLEAREACWGATGRNGGHCAPKLFGSPPSIAHYELANYTHLRSFTTTHSIPCFWTDVSSIRAFYSRPIFDIAVSDTEAAANLDPALYRAEIRIIRPGEVAPSLQDLRLGKECVGAIMQTHAASLWPYKLVAWMLERLLAVHGGKGTGRFNLQTHTPVTSLQPLSDGSHILHTTRGQIGAQKVLLCTNAHTSHLLPSFSDLIVPVRGQMSALLPPPSMIWPREVSTKYSYGFIGHGGYTSKQDDYLIQRPMITDYTEIVSELMFGGGRGAARAFGMGQGDDSVLDAPVRKYLRNALNSELDLDNDAELQPLYEWSGIMGYSRDGRAWVGEVPASLSEPASTASVASTANVGLEGGKGGLYVCAGFTGHGMANASLAAKWVADLMVGRESEVNLPEELQISGERIERARMRVRVQEVDLMEDDLHM